MINNFRTSFHKSIFITKNHLDECSWTIHYNEDYFINHLLISRNFNCLPILNFFVLSSKIKSIGTIESDKITWKDFNENTNKEFFKIYKATPLKQTVKTLHDSVFINLFNELTSVFFFVRPEKNAETLKDTKFPTNLRFLINFQKKKMQYLYGVYDSSQSFRCIYDEEKNTIYVLWEGCSLFSVKIKNDFFEEERKIIDCLGSISIVNNRIDYFLYSSKVEYKIMSDFFKVHNKKSE